MTWAKVDDGFLDHPKVLRAGEDAANLYLRALIWCNKHLTDGHIPREALRALSMRSGLPALAGRLVAVGLWEETADGWYVHDFAAHNPLRADVEAKRQDLSQKRSDAGKRGGRRSGEIRGVEAKAKQLASPVASGLLKQNEAPSRPVQYRRESQTHARAPDPPTDQTPEATPEATPEPRCPTSEPAAPQSAPNAASATDPADVLAKLRVASEGLVADPNVASAGELIAVQRAVDALLSRGVALDAIVRSARHLAHGHWTQRAKRTVITAGRLVEERAGRGSILGELLAELDGCEQCRPAAPKRTLSHPLRIVELPAISEAEAAGKRALLARALGGERVLA